MKSIFILFAIAALPFTTFAKVEAPTPELTKAVQKITTSGPISKVETGWSGLKTTYEVDVSTPNSGRIEIELLKDGYTFVEAEGQQVTKDVVFNPGNGLKSLSDVSGALAKYPDFKADEWSLEEKSGRWVYEVSGLEKGVEREYVFDAKNLSVLKIKYD